MAKGYIYIMTNPALQNMVKLGYAKDVEIRRQQLSTTALPYDYEIYATYETPGYLEDKKLHKLIDNLNPDLRVSRNREFFVMTPEEAYELLESIAIISGSKDKLRKYVSEESVPQQIIKKPALDFEKCGIPMGAELVFVNDDSIKVTVCSNRKVMYNNEITPLSAVARSVLGYNCAGPSFFTYNGEMITDIAARTQWREYR